MLWLALLSSAAIPTIALDEGPAGVSLALSGSSVLGPALAEELAARLTATWGSTVDLIEPARVAACMGGFACLARLARPDYQRGELFDESGALLPYARHLEEMRDRLASVSRLVIVVSVLDSGAGAQAVWAVFDPDRALALWHDASRTREDWEVGVEAKIDAELVEGDRRPLPVATADARERFIAGVVRALEGPIRRFGPAGPVAELLVSADGPGYELYIDDRAPQRLSQDTVLVRPIAPGRHRVRARRTGREAWASEIEVPPAGRAELRVVAAVAEPPEWPREAAIWGGGAAALTGVGFGIAAMVLASSARAPLSCLTIGVAPSCPPARRIDFGFDPNDPTRPGSGVPIAAVSLGLIGFGATTAIATLLDGSAEVPWIPLALGLLAGAGGVVVGSVY